MIFLTEPWHNKQWHFSLLITVKLQLCGNSDYECSFLRGSKDTVITATAEFTAPSRDQGFAGQPPVEGLSRAAVAAELDKILSSATFIRSKRLGRFLRFTVEQCLDGHQQSLKEYLVGVEVFNKMESFDPRIDSIVRVEARRLRTKLERYYQTEGKDDQVIIQFRKGSYVPLLLTREQLKHMGIDEYGARCAVKTVVVSRFSNLGVDPSHSHFCTGLTEDIVSALTKLQGLRVMSRLNQSGEETRADYMLEGSVRKQGDRLRIAVQLIDCATSLYIWSETYERSLEDVFAVQDDISNAVATSLRRECSATARA
jgi:TolB-like protein